MIILLVKLSAKTKALILAVLLAILCLPALAEKAANPTLVREARMLGAQITEINNYIESLKNDLEEAKQANNKQKERVIADLLSKSQKRLSETAAKLAPLYDYYYRSGYEITRKDIDSGAPLIPATLNVTWEAGSQSAVIIEAGLKGGTGLLEIDYALPFRRTSRSEFRIGAGYGIGANYTLSLFRGLWILRPNPNYFWAISLDFANYLEKASGIVGLPQITDKGSRTGIGGCIGKSLWIGDVSLGYSSALGLTAAVGRQF